MNTLLIALLVLSAVMLCTPRGAQSRAEIRAAAQVASWRAVAPAARLLAVQALHLLVEALRVVVHFVVFAAQVLAIVASHLETAGAPREAS
jgi:hypothetical protein